MQNSRPAPPPYPEKLTVVLLGNNVKNKNRIGNLLLKSDYFSSTKLELIIGETAATSVINTPDFFDNDDARPDQRIIDIMAITYPGPDLFLLVLDQKSSTEELVVEQIGKLQDIFGEKIMAHLVIMFPDMESQARLQHLTEIFSVRAVIATDNLASECRGWKSVENVFPYDFTNYSKEVVLRRRTELEKRRSNQSHDYENIDALVPSGPPPTTFNFVFLGLSGRGKSASANTILATGSSGKKNLQPFESRTSSVPITRHCDVRFMTKPFGIPVCVVDTPDFFNEEVIIPEQEVSECRKFLYPGCCVPILVIRLGRLSSSESQILLRLEKKIGWKIREDAMVLLTHKEELRGPLDQYIEAHERLKALVERCGSRCCAFNNNCKDPQQVYELVKKIPDYKSRFPEMHMKKPFDCSTC